MDCKAFYKGTRCINKCKENACPGSRIGKCISDSGFDGPIPMLDALEEKGEEEIEFAGVCNIAPARGDYV